MNLTTVPASSRFLSDRKLDKRIDLVRGATSKSGGVQLGTAIAGGCAGKKGVGQKIWRQTNPFLFAHGASF